VGDVNGAGGVTVSAGGADALLVAAAAPASRTLAPFGRRRCAVLANRLVGAYRVLEAHDPQGPRPQAGQFYMLATAGRWGAGEGQRPYLPRAFSVLRARDERLQFLLEDVGPGTNRLAAATPGEDLLVVGPLGAGFAAPAPGSAALLVGGGVGIAPLAIWQDDLMAAGIVQAALLGFRDRERAAGAGLLADPAVATDDGSLGHAGLVTDLLGAALDGGASGTVYACGPPPMLEAVRALCAARGVPAQLALEAPMACGFGACLGCVVPTRAGYRRVCVDGPVFDAGALETALAPPGVHP
jgi:dihydroorotate dehydrogenase electron transfer subunit